MTFLLIHNLKRMSAGRVMRLQSNLGEMVLSQCALSFSQDSFSFSLFKLSSKFREL